MRVAQGRDGMARHFVVRWVRANRNRIVADGALYSLTLGEKTIAGSVAIFVAKSAQRSAGRQIEKMMHSCETI